MPGGYRTRSRRLAPVAVFLILILSLSGCGRAAPASPAKPITTIRFACLDENVGYYQGLAAEFTAGHPEILVEVQPRRSLAIQALRPDESDVFTVSVPIEPRLERGDLLSLDGMRPDKDDIYPCALAPFIRDGKTWALPLGVTPMLMYYNKDLFNAHQVPYPKAGWTWDEFLATAGKLREYDNDVYGYGAGLSPEDALLFVLQNGGSLVDNWQKPTRLTFDNPQAIEALNWYVGLIYDHGVAPIPRLTIEELGPRGLYGGVLDGQVAMWAAYFPLLDPDGKVRPNWGVAVLPRGREQATLAEVEGVAISARTAHPEQCWQWVDFLSHQVPEHMAPARRSLAQSPAFAKQVGAEAAAAVGDSLEHALVLPRAPADLYARFDTLWAKALGDMLSGKFDPLHALQIAQQKKP